MELSKRRMLLLATLLVSLAGLFVVVSVQGETDGVPEASADDGSDDGTIKVGDSFEDGGLKYTLLEDETLKCDGPAKGESPREVNIPKDVRGYDVTDIGYRAFYGEDALLSVSIPSGVRIIEDYAFSFCKSLVSVEIPDSVQKIGDYAYDYCSAVKTVVIGSGVQDIGDFAFGSCGGLRTLTIGDKVQVIGDHAFSSCEVLESVVFPDSVRVIGDGAFSFCEAIKNITISEHVLTIGDGAFRSCGALKSIEVDEANASYASIDGVLFSKDPFALMCYPGGKSDSRYEVPDGTLAIEDEAFEWCKAIRYVTIPGSVKTIGEEAFDYCEALESVTIGDGVQTIEDRAFANCSKLDTITVPGSVQDIGELVFHLCNALRSVTVDEANTAYRSVGGVLFSKDLSVLIHYPGDKPNLDYTVPEEVRVIEESAFTFCDNIESVTVGDNVRIIGESAFECCKDLETVDIGSGIQKIEDCTFRFCDSLRTVTIGDNVQKIGGYAFSLCYDLEEITIPASVKNVGTSAFFACRALKDITFEGDAPLKLGNGCLLLGDVNNRIRCTIHSSIYSDDNPIPGKATSEYTTFTYVCPDIPEPMILDGSMITILDEAVYNGHEQNVRFEVANGTAVLVEGVDYRVVSGSAGTGAGTYVLTVEGLGDYTGKESVEWAISPKTLDDSMIVIKGELTYDGMQQRVGFAVSDGSTPLLSPNDYTIVPGTDVGKETGSYVLRIEGAGNYCGAASAEWAISSAEGPGQVMITWKYGLAQDKSVKVPVHVGETPVAPEGVAIEGYSFFWIPGIVEATEDATYTAKYSANKYTVTFDPVNGSEKIIQGLRYGAEIEAPETPEKEDYRFLGWEGYTDGMTVPAYDVTFVAQWQLQTQRVNDIEIEGGNKVSYPVDEGVETVVFTPTEQNDGRLDVPSKVVATFGATDYVVAKGLNLAIHGTLVCGDGVRIIVEEGATLFVCGTIKTASPVKVGEYPVQIDVREGGVLKAYPGAMVAENIQMGGAGDILLDRIIEVIEIDQNATSSNTYTQLQKVVVIDSIDLETTTTTTVLGKFTVNEGVTLTIEDGAKLMVKGDTALVDIKGTVIVEKGGSFVVEGAKAVDVSGRIDLEGELSIDSNTAVKADGAIETEEDSQFTATKGLTVEKDARLVIGGNFSMTGDNVVKGTVVLDYAVAQDFSPIQLVGEGATADIVFATMDGAAALVVADTSGNGVAVTAAQFGGIAGLKVVEGKRVYTADKDVEGDVDLYQMNVEGRLSMVDHTPKNVPDIEEVTFELDAAETAIVVAGDLVIGTGIQFVNDGRIEVPDASTVDLTDAKGVSNSAEKSLINVKGTVKDKASESRVEDTKINAVMYKDGDAKIFTTFEKAVASGVKDLNVFGFNVVEQSVNVPTRTNIRLIDEAELQVGTQDNYDVVVNVADSSEVRDGTIEVFGTLFFERMQDNGPRVASDVVIGGLESGDPVVYTNVNAALVMVQPGDTVAAARDLVIDSELTIPEDVVLQVSGDKTVVLTEKGRLNVLGTLSTDNLVIGAFGTDKEGNDAPKMQVGIRGTIVSPVQATYDDYLVAGAYYKILDSRGDLYYITSIEASALVADKAVEKAILVCGDVKTTEVSFTGSETGQVQVFVFGDLVADKIVLTDALLDIEGSYSGKVETAQTVLDLRNVSLTIVSSFSAFKDKGFEGTAVAGMPVRADAEKEAVLEVVSGAVCVKETLAVDSEQTRFLIDAGAVLTVSGKDAELDADFLVIDGSLIVTNGGNVLAGLVTVNGLLQVDPKVETNSKKTVVPAGTAQIDAVLVGTTLKEITGGEIDIEGAAEVRGDFTIKEVMVVKAGAVVDPALVEDVKSTLFVIEDADWVTAYDFGVGSIMLWKEMDTKELLGWNGADDAFYGDDDEIVIADEAKVTAEIDYNVYTVQVNAVAGIDAVYLDGILMLRSNIDKVLYADMVAYGPHTISFTLSNLYEGTADMLLDGKKIASGAAGENMQFTIDSSYKDKSVYRIDLQNIKSSAVPGIDTTSEDFYLFVKSTDDGVEIVFLSDDGLPVPDGEVTIVYSYTIEWKGKIFVANERMEIPFVNEGKKLVSKLPVNLNGPDFRGKGIYMVGAGFVSADKSVEENADSIVYS